MGKAGELSGIFCSNIFGIDQRSLEAIGRIAGITERGASQYQHRLILAGFTLYP